MKTKDSIRQSVAEYLQATCPHGSEQVAVGMLVIMVHSDSWKVYWDDGQYMVFSNVDGFTSDREVNAIHCLLMQHMASESPAPIDWAKEMRHLKETAGKAIHWIASALDSHDGEVLIQPTDIDDTQISVKMIDGKPCANWSGQEDLFTPLEYQNHALAIAVADRVQKAIEKGSAQ